VTDRGGLTGAAGGLSLRLARSERDRPAVLPIHLASVTNQGYLDLQAHIVHGINDAPVADVNSPEGIGAL
jgi:hypothetical protein